jgi:hypothetical protein
MTPPAEIQRPPLLMSVEGQIQIVALADAASRRHPLVARLLHEEADRTELVPAAELPATTVALGSAVEFHDSAGGETRSVQLVLPGEADIADAPPDRAARPVRSQLISEGARSVSARACSPPENSASSAACTARDRATRFMPVKASLTSSTL